MDGSHELEQRDHELRVLEHIARGGPLAEVLTEIVLSYEALFPGMRGSALLLDQESRLRHGAAPHLPAEYCEAVDGVEIGLNVGSCGTAAYTGKSSIVTDIASDPQWSDYKDLALAHGLRACWSVPILAGAGRVLGTFAFYFDEPRAAVQWELDAIERGAFLASVAIGREQAEVALRSSDARHKSLLELLERTGAIARVGGWELNLRTMELFWSAETCRIHELDDLVAPTLEEAISFYAPAARRIIEAAVQAGIQRGTPWDLELPLITAKGRPIWVRAQGSAVMEDGKAVSLLGAFQEITERKREEAQKSKLEVQLQQAQKLESVGRLAGGVAHDFNNMLGVILGHTECALQEIDETHALHEDLLEIQKAAQRSAALTRQLLAYARKQTIVPMVLNLNDEVGGMLTMLRRLIGEDITVNWSPGPHLWPVRLDPSQVGQILTNLCLNGRDAIAGVGTITIETGNFVIDRAYCATHPDALPGEYVRLAVRDTGAGIDPARLDQIFEPFYTTKDPGHGTGLGLAMVYGAVRQNLGFSDVSSEAGSGTTLAVYLRRHRGAEESVTDSSLASGANVSSVNGRGHETILLVEDEPAILNLAARVLLGKGYTVLSASSPREAIDLAREHDGPIHLLLTDVIMPGMNGRDLAATLLPRHLGLKCLYMSGYTADTIALHGKLDASVDFLQKPFSVDELIARTRKALDNQKQNELP